FLWYARIRAAACVSASRWARGRRASAPLRVARGNSSSDTVAALTPSYLPVHSSSAASPRVRTSATISPTRRRTSLSSVASNAVSAPSRSPKSRWAVVRRAISGTLAHRFGESVEERLHRVALQLERGLVDDQARADGAHLLDGVQSVGAQRVAGRHQIDDRVCEPEQRRELHRAVELDEVDVHALRREVLARGLHELGRDAQARPAA